MSNSASSCNIWEGRDLEAVLPLHSITTCISRHRTFLISTSTGSMKGINLPILSISKFYNSMELPTNSLISIQSQFLRTHHPSATKNSSPPRLSQATTPSKTVRLEKFTTCLKTQMALEITLWSPQITQVGATLNSNMEGPLGLGKATKKSTYQ